MSRLSSRWSHALRVAFLQTADNRNIRRQPGVSQSSGESSTYPDINNLNFQRLETPDKFEGGLTPDRVQRFPTFSADQKSVDDGCAICIDGVEINKPMIRLDCSHFYCSECITKWFEKSSSCPLCRKKFYN